jgi:hypothetical protein
VREYDLAGLGGFAKVLHEIGAFHPTPEDEAWFRAVSDLVDRPPEELEDLFDEDERAAEEMEAQMRRQPEDDTPPMPMNGKEDEDIAEMEEVV